MVTGINVGKSYLMKNKEIEKEGGSLEDNRGTGAATHTEVVNVIQ